MTTYTIDVLESNPTKLKNIRAAFWGKDYIVRDFSRPRDFLAMFESNPPDLVMADLELDDDRSGGIKVLQKIRAAEGDKRDTRVILLGEETSLAQRCEIYNCGGDAFMPIPFETKELAALVSAHMRRIQKKKEVLHFGPFALDKIEREARKNSQTLNLTNCEFLIYECLMEAQGAIVERKDLYKAFGDPHKPFDPKSKALDMHIKSLREKLGEDGRYIKSVYGGGYKMSE